VGLRQSLQILLIEDNDDDAMRIGRELRKAGLRFQSHRVDREEHFLRELRERRPDVILSDHGLPSFDGFTALDIAQKQCPDVPFIFVTGTSDLRLIIEMIESGATDCVYKSRMSELAPAVTQAVRDVEEKRRRLAALPALASQPRDVQDAAPSVRQPLARPRSRLLCARCKRLRNEHGQWESIDLYLHHLEFSVSVGLCPDCAEARGLQTGPSTRG
jgi:DNA-binding NtrC family response regulator